MRAPRFLVPTLLIVTVADGLLATGAPAATPKTVIFNMYPSPLVKPARVFFQANSGPFLDALAWTGWGEATAVGTGTWRLDCSTGGVSCAPGDPSLAYPATYTLTDLAPCPRFGKGAMSYREGVVKITRPDSTVTQPFSSDYDFCAKRPTFAKGRAAILAYLRRHHARRASATCKARDGVSLDCVARYTTAKGNRRTREFDVWADMRGRITARPLG